jgi:hypothetical protein
MSWLMCILDAGLIVGHCLVNAALQVPNAVLVDIPGSAGGCSCIASSRDGRWLAAACADADGKFKVPGGGDS